MSEATMNPSTKDGLTPNLLSKRAISFARALSTSTRERNRSIKRQLRYCHEIAKEQHLHVVHEYVAHGDLTEPAVRVVIEELLAEIDTGEIGCLITLELVLLADRQDDITRLMERLKAMDVRLITAHDVAREQRAALSRYLTTDAKGGAYDRIHP